MDDWDFTQSDLDALLAQDVSDFGLTPQEALTHLQSDGALSDYDLDALMAQDASDFGLTPQEALMYLQSNGALSAYDVRALDQMPAQQQPGTMVELRPPGYNTPQGGLGAAANTPANTPADTQNSVYQWLKTQFGGAGEQTPRPDVNTMNERQLREEMLRRYLRGSQEKPAWQNMLQLGLAGLGGLSAYSAANRYNKALGQSAAANQVAAQQARDQQAAFEARRNRPMVYGTPATTGFQRI